MTIRLLITGPEHQVLGDPLAEWTDLDATIRFNQPASGSVELPAWPEVMELLQPGNRLQVIRDGAVWTEGPLEIPQDYTWSVGSGPGTVRVYFTDDLAVPAGYITWPAPASTWAAQPFTAERRITNTNAETIIRTLIDETCGPGALADRQIPGLVLDTAAGVGSVTSITTRFEGLLEACRRAAVNGGGLGFRTSVQAGQIVFTVYAPRDLTATARFSKSLGNLRAITYKQSGPTVTHALVSGSHTEADPAADPPVAESRTYLEVSNTTASTLWWRVEKHVDGSATDDSEGELTADGAEQLETGSAPVELATATVDTQDLRAGRDFGLGDRVTVALPTSQEVADVVRSIHLQATPTSGEYVTSLIGSPEATRAPEMVRLVRELGRRLGQLEAR